MSTSELFRQHVETLSQRAVAGDEFAVRSLSCLALLADGWRYGDPDPVDMPPDGGGENVFDLDSYWRIAA